jgi:hypothetical protein
MSKLLIRCGKCGDVDTSDEKSLMIDFKEQEIYYYCRKCEKDNSIKLKKTVPGSLPSILKGK